MSIATLAAGKLKKVALIAAMRKLVRSSMRWSEMPGIAKIRMSGLDIRHGYFGLLRSVRVPMALTGAEL